MDPVDEPRDDRWVAARTMAMAPEPWLAPPAMLTRWALEDFRMEDAMSLTNLLVPTFAQMLSALSTWLDKGAAREAASGRVADEVLSLRLAADMYPLSSQVRFACFQAQEPVYRLRGEPLPEALLEVRREGWSGGEQPGTLAQAQGRIAEAIQFLTAVGPNALDEGAGLAIVLGLPNGMAFNMTGESYARDWALPQFYFHVTTAYGILRNHGTELGKADYVAHMLRYLPAGMTANG